ncbi:hypothetical protein Q5P01_013214 [Channa striata]|uniref:ORM1-like protein 3 n=1 Tax=Channa striata TaxID=64152 RepID=A0AA88SK40_CHASR|nr:hypothetical protein Q5P01_013214 [Channa striata]
MARFPPPLLPVDWLEKKQGRVQNEFCGKSIPLVWANSTLFAQIPGLIAATYQNECGCGTHVPVVWTLTNVIHNFGMYVFMHAVKGTPFETPDQGKARLLTHWEQLDYGVQFTSSRKFFTISPIILYFLTSFYTKYDTAHFIINTASLLSVLIPKLPQLHGVRIFGINKY